MEGGKKSRSSFTSDLFGSKDSDVAASASGIFWSIFAPPAKVVGNYSLHMPEKEKKHDSGSQSWNSKTAVSESNAVKGEGNFQRSEGKDMGPFYLVENVHPCQYSSSIYYGGQDICSRPKTAQSTVFTTYWPQAVGNDYLHMPEKEKKHDSGSQSWNSKTAVSESNAVKGEGNFQRSEGKDMGPFYPVENVHPCHYSSSIYYGGQDICSRPQTAQSTVFTTFNKDGGEDDSDGASRGNWWQGSLYY